MAENVSPLISALRDASQTADPTTVRYALDYLELRGEAGSICATDGKQLLDTKHPVFRMVARVRHDIQSTWRALSLPYPEPGIRLIRVNDVDEFNRRMNELREQLEEAVSQLDEHYAELKSAARQRLGSLFDPRDYPASVRGMFGVAWDFPNVEPPAYLQNLNPDLYEEECRRVAARFDDAVQLAEEAFIAELNGLVEHLLERLSGQTDGKPKIFRDSCPFGRRARL